jgi:hypothetical protein
MKIAVSALSLMIPFSIMAQIDSAEMQKQKNLSTQHRIEVKIGPTSPLSDLSSSNPNYGSALYARGGVGFGIGYEFHADENIAITADYQSTSFNVNEEEFQRNLNDSDPSLSYSFSQEPLRLTFIGVGVKEKFGNDVVKGFVNPKFGNARFVFTDAVVRFRDTQSSFNGTITTEETEESKIAYAIAFGSDIKLSKIISIGFEFEYFVGGNFSLNTGVRGSNNQGGSLNQTFEEEFYIAIFNSFFSLGFNF